MCGGINTATNVTPQTTPDEDGVISALEQVKAEDNATSFMVNAVTGGDINITMTYLNEDDEDVSGLLTLFQPNAFDGGPAASIRIGENYDGRAVVTLEGARDLRDALDNAIRVQEEGLAAAQTSDRLRGSLQDTVNL